MVICTGHLHVAWLSWVVFMYSAGWHLCSRHQRDIEIRIESAVFLRALCLWKGKDKSSSVKVLSPQGQSSSGIWDLVLCCCAVGYPDFHPFTKTGENKMARRLRRLRKITFALIKTTVASHRALLWSSGPEKLPYKIYLGIGRTRTSQRILWRQLETAMPFKCAFLVR